MASAIAEPGEVLADAAVQQVLIDGLEDMVAGERALVLVPDKTRAIPLGKLFPMLAKALHRAASVDVMVALGTHPPLPLDQLLGHLGLADHDGRPVPRVFNHDWADPSVLASIGTLSMGHIRDVAGPDWHPSLGGDLVVRVNRAAIQADRVIVVGPTLPHEVAGFSGGAKYIFPGIAGPEMIDVMHWLGALHGAMATIGQQQTPVRRLIDRALALLPTPVSLVALVTPSSRTGFAGMFVGDLAPAWQQSVRLADELHTVWLDHPYERVISCPLPIYDELWTAAKAMYKLEAAVADGGELIIYAPQLSNVSHTHGRQIFTVGYHVLEYFIKQWPHFKDFPLAVLAHSTHVKGAGTFEAQVERPRIDVRLATGISEADCERLNLGYTSPTLDPARAGDDVLVVPRAGEVVYKLAGMPARPDRS